MDNAFPRNFLWGTATAGHQVDGGDDNADTTFVEHLSHTIFREPAGTADNSWRQWSDDLDLVKAMGLNAYRFSVEWSRIEPRQGTVDISALDHYDRMVDGCLERGITPVVTLNHFTAPHWFARQGGLLSPDAAALFADECTRVCERIGDRVGAFITFNEPNLPQILKWADLPDVDADTRAMLDEAAAVADTTRYRLGNIVLRDEFEPMIRGYAKAHRSAVAAIRAACTSQVPVGLSLSVVDDVPGDEGGEPVVEAKRAECYGVWKDIVAEDDFIGVQNYERCVYGATGLMAVPEGAPTNDAGAGIDPASLVHCVKYINALTGLPVMITEHGIGTADDGLRCRFLRASLEHLASERDDVPVLGYMHWSLEDNFEWIAGYTSFFGLHSVNRDTFARTPKPSAKLYAELVDQYRAAAR